MANGLNQLALALQGFGAGIQGRLPEFLAMRQQMDDRRRQAMLIDNRRSMQLVEQGNIDAAKQLLQNRIKNIRELGGDPSDTLRQYQLLEAGNIRDFQTNAMTLDQAGVARKLLNPIQIQEKFEEVRDAQGNIIGQRSTTTGRVVSDPRAASRVAPATAIGRARNDLNNGFITQKEFEQITKAPGGFQSSVGKLISDRQRAVQLFGENSEQVRSFDEAISKESQGEKPKLSDEAGLRKEFTKLSGDFITLRDAIGKVNSAAENPSPAGDLSLIFNFMKILDPGSVVREGEFANAQNSAGVPERIRAQYNSVVNGQRLTGPQRADFVGTAGRMFSAQLQKQRRLENQFTGIAERKNMNPQDIVVDFIGPNRKITGQSPERVNQIKIIGVE